MCSPSSPAKRWGHWRPSSVTERRPCSPTPTNFPPPNATSTSVSTAFVAVASVHSFPSFDIAPAAVAHADEASVAPRDPPQDVLDGDRLVVAPFQAVLG